jgi:RNA polymerase sigma factor (sigma-70 family)
MLAELSKLPPQQRAVLVLRYYDGLDDRRIGELLGVAAGTVRSYASRALATLRIEMTWEPAAIGLAMEERR